MYSVNEPERSSNERAHTRTAPARAHTRSQADVPLLSRPGIQIVYAVLGSAAVAAGWMASDRVFGAAVAFVLLLVPLVNAPFVLCIAFVVVSEFRIPEAFPALHSLRIPEMLAIATLGCLVWHLFLTRRIRPFWSTELTLFALFFLHVAICAVFASNRQAAFDFCTSHYVKVGVIALATAWFCVGPRQFALVSVTFMFSGLAIGLVALWNKAHGIGLVEGGRVTIGRELGSPIGDPNDLALVLLFGLAFCLGLALTRGVPAALRLIGLVTIGVIVAAIIATESRGGLLGAVAVFLPFFRKALRSRFLLVVIAAASIVIFYSVSGIGERATVVVGAGESLDASANGRLLAWEAAIRMALADPLTGVGINNFVENYFFFTDEWHGKATAAHSMWFEVLGENGFVGLSLFIALMSVTAGGLLRVHRRLDAIDSSEYARALTMSLLAGFCGLVVSGSFLSQAYGWPLYITLALSFAVSRYSSLGMADHEIGVDERGGVRVPPRPALN